MLYQFIFFIMILWSSVLHATSSINFFIPEGGVSEYWGEEDVWWHGRTSFKGQVIIPACSLAMEDVYQTIDLGSIPARDLQNSFVGTEKKFNLRLRNCELAGTGYHAYTASRVRVTFDGVQDDSPDKFSLFGEAQGVSLQILDNQGALAYPGRFMLPQLLNGNEEKLSYTIRLVRNTQPLKVGKYYAALRFKVDYE
ncbi:type 1 fimbrial protein [Escherichia coli]|nr:type 1 fimbrial protein [Escherichia coli]EGF7412903.1 type 1 fimbrial protein [Escherichia coli]EGF7454051.1 type 1 fimbrial protein [Escherichia coli]